MTPQQQRIQRHQELRQRRNELYRQITVGEDSLLTSEDDETRRSLDRRISVMRNDLRALEAELANNPGETFHEFAERMGCEHIQIGRDDQLSIRVSELQTMHLLPGWYFFRNGACSDGFFNHAESPQDETIKLSREAEYLTRRLANEEKKFWQCKSYINEQSSFHSMGAGPLPEEQAYKDLESFQQCVLQLRDELMRAKNQLQKSAGPSMSEAVYKSHSSRVQAAREARQRAEQLEI